MTFIWGMVQTEGKIFETVRISKFSKNTADRSFKPVNSTPAKFDDCVAFTIRNIYN